jgi:transposase-like protein
MSELAVAPSRSRQATRQAWIDRLARHRASNLSVAAFCAAEGVSANSFFYWKRQFAASAASPPDAPPRFLPVHVQAVPLPVEVVLPGGAVLRLAPGCDLAFVRSLVEVLGSDSC